MEQDNRIKISIEGVDYLVDGKLFKGYAKEASQHYAVAQDASEKFKEVVEALNDATSIPKPMLSKYLKAWVKAETQKQLELSAAFEQFDKVLNSDGN